MSQLSSTCRCCGIPIEKDKPNSDSGEKCFDCTYRRYAHNSKVCATNRNLSGNMANNITAAVL